MAKTETFDPHDPRPFTWAGAEMWRCPYDRCGWSHEDRDAVIDHIILTGHVGPDDEPEEETSNEQPDTSGARKGGKS